MALAVWTLGGSADAWCRTTTVPAQPDPLVCPREGTPLAWPFACVGLRLDPTTPLPGVSPAVVRRVTVDAMAAWAALPCPGAPAATGSGGPSMRLVLLADRADPVGYFDGEPNANTLALRTAWSDDPFHPPDAAAVTVVTFAPDTAEILDADTELNLEGFRFVVDDDRHGSDLQTILGHEFGHTLGLAHSPERSAVMWYSAGRGEQRRTLSSDDAAGVCAIYPPGPSAVCVPELRRVGLEGGGLPLACGARPRPLPPAPFDRGIVPLGVALAWAWGRRRRTVTARR